MSVVRRTFTGAAIGAAALGLIALDATLAGGLVLWAVLAVLAAVAAEEAGGMLARRKGAGAAALVGGALAALVAAYVDAERGAAPAPGDVCALALPAGAAAVVAVVAARGRPSALLAVWVGAPLAALALWTRGYGHDALIALIAVSKAGDVAGYFVGRRIGRRRPFPVLSPGKTVAGCVASLAAGVAAGAALGGLWTLGPEGLGAARGALLGLLLNVAAQAGDLFESAVKRRTGVKDSGALMGASGGLLDVLDSLLFTAPAAWLLAAWVA